MRVTGTRGVCFVDYILQTCELMGGSLLKNIAPTSFSFDALQELYRTTDRIQFGVQKVEPLRAQASQFLAFLAETLGNVGIEAELLLVGARTGDLLSSLAGFNRLLGHCEEIVPLHESFLSVRVG